MKVKSTCVMLSVLTVGAVAWTGMAGGQVHWGYEGKWIHSIGATLNRSSGRAALGRINRPSICKFVEAVLEPIRFAYKAGSQEILNNGHTVQVNYAAGSSITTEGRVFELKQFHFHAPSENKINGKQFTLEAHLVHADKDDNLAVVAVMFEMGRANSLLAKLWQKFPAMPAIKQQPWVMTSPVFFPGGEIITASTAPSPRRRVPKGSVARDEDPGDGIEGAS